MTGLTSMNGGRNISAAMVSPARFVLRKEKRNGKKNARSLPQARQAGRFVAR